MQREHRGGCRGQRAAENQGPSPRSWIKESPLPPCPPTPCGLGGCAQPFIPSLHTQRGWGWGSASPRLCPRPGAREMRGAALAQMLGLRVKPGHSKTPSSPDRGEDDTPQLRLNPREMGELSTPCLRHPLRGVTGWEMKPQPLLGGAEHPPGHGRAEHPQCGPARGATGSIL